MTDQLDAPRLGPSGTLDALRQMLVDHFGIAREPREIGADEPLFAGGLDLTSLQGLSLILMVEKKFNVRINDLDTSIQEVDTLSRLAQHLIKLASRNQAQSRVPGSTP